MDLRKYRDGCREADASFVLAASTGGDTMTDYPTTPAPVKGGVVAYLTLDGAVEAAKFYEKAFGAEVACINPPDEKGRTMHAHLYINGSSVMLSDFFPEMGMSVAPVAGCTLMILTGSIDADYQRAVDAGCTATMPPADMFWGDRYGQLNDPFGLTWSMNQGAPRA
jgi:PhnB protein